MPLYPLPTILSSFGFIMIWVTSPSYFLYGNTHEPLIEFSLLVVVIGCISYFVWAYGRGYWPFEREGEELIDEEAGEEEKPCHDEHDARFSPRPEVASKDPVYNQNALRHSPAPSGMLSPHSQVGSQAGAHPHASLAPGLVEDPKRSPRMWLSGWRDAKVSPRPHSARRHSPNSSPVPVPPVSSKKEGIEEP